MKNYKYRFDSFKNIWNLIIFLVLRYFLKDFKDLDKPKYPDGFITHHIIDDMLGTNIFKNGRSLFTNLCIRNRHVTPSNCTSI